MYVLAKDKHNENTDTSDLFAIFLTIEDGSDIKQLLSFVKLTGTTSKLILNFVLLSAFYQHPVVVVFKYRARPY